MIYVANFAEWVKTTRGTDTQVACAARAGMTPQQWNQIEKLVKQPEAETAKRVALGLGVTEHQALAAAGYAVPGESGMRLAQQIESYLLQAPVDKRQTIEAATVQFVRTMVGVAA